MNRRLARVRAASLRVALVSTAITALVFAVISVVIVMYVTQTLTSQIDGRLASSIGSLQNGRIPNIPLGTLSDPGGARFGPGLLAWRADPDGNVTPSDPTALLPVAARSISTPSTVSIGGIDVRVSGGAVGDQYYVVGQTLAAVSQARSTIIVAEAIVGAGVLVLVFFGAIAVGRRVGSPIELARQRQMEFTADASHELRTPLSVIEAQTSLALSHDRDPDWYRNAFQRVGNESQRIRRLVEDLLWLARVDTAAGQAHAEPVELGVLARQAVDRFAAVAEARQVQLTVLAAGEPLIVNGTPEWLDRLLGVLLDNACKYAPKRGQVAVTVDGDGNRVRLRVEDSGPGIAPDERPRIFDRFHRASDQVGGAGLGLAIADAVVARTHGRWEIGGSARLGGASVAVSWPRVMAGAREAGPAPAPVPQPQ